MRVSWLFVLLPSLCGAFFSSLFSSGKQRSFLEQQRESVAAEQRRPFQKYLEPRRAEHTCENRFSNVSTVLYASRLDDGVCDCCDGSDEVAVVACPDRCEEEASADLALKKVMREAYSSGRVVRERALSEAAATAAAADDSSSPLAALTKRRDFLQQQVDERERAVEDRIDAVRVNTQPRVEAILGFTDLDVAAKAGLLVGLMDLFDVTTLDDCPDGGEGREEDEEAAQQDDEDPRLENAAHCTAEELLMRLMEGHVQHTQQQESVQMLMAYYRLNGKFGVEAVEFARGNPAAECSMHFEGFSETAAVSNCEMAELLKFALEPLFAAIEENPLPVASETEEGQLLSSLTRQIEDHNALQASLTKFQPDFLEYWPVRDACFERKEGQYTYKVCLGGSVEQDGVSLGTLERIERDEETGGAIFRFQEGQYCHAFGPRSAEVHVACGLVSAPTLISVSEPSTCQYHLVVEAPHACTDAFALKHNLL